jgi:hypothetical protein
MDIFKDCMPEDWQFTAFPTDRELGITAKVRVLSEVRGIKEKAVEKFGSRAKRR